MVVVWRVVIGHTAGLSASDRLTQKQAVSLSPHTVVDCSPGARFVSAREFAQSFPKRFQGPSRRGIETATRKIVRRRQKLREPDRARGLPHVMSRSAGGDQNPPLSAAAERSSAISAACIQECLPDSETVRSCGGMMAAKQPCDQEPNPLQRRPRGLHCHLNKSRDPSADRNRCDCSGRSRKQGSTTKTSVSHDQNLQCITLKKTLVQHQGH